MNKFLNLYALLFSRPLLAPLHKLLLKLSLRGLGILNHSTPSLSGERHFLAHYLENFETPTVFDIGANVGNYSHLAHKANSQSKIFAFEPHPKNFEILKNTVSSFAKAEQLAIGSKKLELLLYDYEQRDGSTHASIYESVITDIHKKSSTNHKVDCQTLDEYCTNKRIAEIDLLKIDIEGNELDCLRGASQLLKERKIKAIHFEFNEMNIISNAHFKDFWDILQGFTLYRILPRGKLLKISRYTPLYCELYAYQNIVAIASDQKFKNEKL